MTETHKFVNFYGVGTGFLMMALAAAGRFKIDGIGAATAAAGCRRMRLATSTKDVRQVTAALC